MFSSQVLRQSRLLVVISISFTFITVATRNPIVLIGLYGLGGSRDHGSTLVAPKEVSELLPIYRVATGNSVVDLPLGNLRLTTLGHLFDLPPFLVSATNPRLGGYPIPGLASTRSSSGSAGPDIPTALFIC